MNDTDLAGQATGATALEWSRRHLLRAASGGMVGLGMVQHAAPRTLAQGFPTCNANLLVLSKKLGGAAIRGFECEECQCEGRESLLITYDMDLILSPNLDCDETDALIPGGSTLQGSALHLLRRKGPAGRPVGSFEVFGEVLLIDPSGVPLATVDQLEGTLGFDSRAGHPGMDRCARFPGGSGFLRMTGIEGTALERSTIVATFDTLVQLDPSDDPCLPWNDWVLWIDGILNFSFCPSP